MNPTNGKHFTMKVVPVSGGHVKSVHWKDCMHFTKQTDAKCYHTVLNPRLNSGVCSAKFCEFCKPRECCGPHHKQFVIDPDAMAGVCVRHTDDCTPLCVKSMTGKRVCSKGCNSLATVSERELAEGKPTGSHGNSGNSLLGDPLHTETHTLGESSSTQEASENLAVCQADKIIQCHNGPGKSETNSGLDEDIKFAPLANVTRLESCAVEKQVACKSVCKGLTAVEHSRINAIVGGTCLIAMQENLQCFAKDSKMFMCSLGGDDSAGCNLSSRHESLLYALPKLDAQSTCEEIIARCNNHETWGNVHILDKFNILKTVHNKCKSEECTTSACRAVALAF